MNDTLDELLPALREAIDDPDADVDTLSRLAGLTLYELGRLRQVPPDVATRADAELWREAETRSTGRRTIDLVRSYARRVLDLASRVHA